MPIGGFVGLADGRATQPSGAATGHFACPGVGVGAHHRACHTALVEGYVIEGHVGAREIARLLDERPDALGLVVPGMPLGSPGMDFGNRRQPYETLLVTRNGEERVFARHEE